MITKELEEFVAGLGLVQILSDTTAERRGEFSDIKFLSETKVFLLNVESSIFIFIVISQEDRNFEFVVDSVVCQFGSDINFVLENNFIEGIRNFIEN